MIVSKLKQLMEERHVSQTELSEIAGVSQAFICNMLKGHKMPSVVVLKRIADYFGKTTDYFLSGK